MAINVTLLIPPAFDWSMPLIALPLLKTYLPASWSVKILDINAKLFSSEFKYDILMSLKRKFIEAIEKKDLIESVDTCLEIESVIASKRIGKATLHGRSLSILDKWYDSCAVYDYLKEKDELKDTITKIISSFPQTDKTDVFGISITVEEQILPSFIVCSIIRAIYPNAKILLGGNIVTRLYDSLLVSKLSSYYDMLILGEGEDQLEKAIRAVLSSDKSSEKLFRRDTIMEPQLFCHLNTPDYSDIDWNDYLSPVRILPITAQRKCKWSRCDFCAIHTSWEGGTRDRGDVAVVDEIEMLSKKYDTKYFRFVDEMVSIDYLYDLSNLLLERNISIYYEAYVRFEEGFSRKERVKTIYDGGCRQLFWGLENINDDALVFMNKGTTKALIDRCLQETGNVGITNYCFVLLGIPKIGYEAEAETIAYVAANHNIHVGVVGSFVIDKNSPIHLDPEMHEKYNITLIDAGDLTTEVGYLYNGKDIRQKNKRRIAEMVINLFRQRMDYSLCSLLSEENRLVLTAAFGNAFAEEYMNAVPAEKSYRILQQSTATLIEERITRRVEEKSTCVV